MESTLAALYAVVCQPVDRIVQHDWGKISRETPAVRYKLQDCQLADNTPFGNHWLRPRSEATTELPRATRCPSVEKLRRECSWMCAPRPARRFAEGHWLLGFLRSRSASGARLSPRSTMRLGRVGQGQGLPGFRASGLPFQVQECLAEQRSLA